LECSHGAAWSKRNPVVGRPELDKQSMCSSDGKSEKLSLRAIESERNIEAIILALIEAAAKKRQ